MLMTSRARHNSVATRESWLILCSAELPVPSEIHMAKLRKGRLDGLYGMRTFTSGELLAWADKVENQIHDPLNRDDPRWLRRWAQDMRWLAAQKEQAKPTKLDNGETPSNKSAKNSFFGNFRQSHTIPFTAQEYIQWHSLVDPLTRARRKHIIRPFPVRRPRQSSIIPNPSWVLWLS